MVWGPEGYAELLEAERAGTAERVAVLTRELEGIFAASADVATDDEHDPDGATIAFERAQVIALLEQARARLEELDEAGKRLADGSYGVCSRCGGTVAGERLAVRPTARTCITCA